MSCDYAVWHPIAPIETRKASALYAELCEGVTTGVSRHPSIEAFYNELTAQHPEIDNIPEDRIDDTDLCPWTIAFDRSEGYIVMCCAWSKADYCGELISGLAAKYGLTFYDPQSDQVNPTQHRQRPMREIWFQAVVALVNSFPIIGWTIYFMLAEEPDRHVFDPALVNTLRILLLLSTVFVSTNGVWAIALGWRRDISPVAAAISVCLGLVFLVWALPLVWGVFTLKRVFY